MLRNLFLIVPFLLLVHVTSAVALSEWEATQGRCSTDPPLFVGLCLAIEILPRRG